MQTLNTTMKQSSLGFMMLFLTNVGVAVDYQFKTEEKGSSPTYQYDGKRYNDLSAAAVGNGQVLLGFDGGKNSTNPNLRIVNSGLEKPASEINRQIVQKDVEGMTFHKGHFYSLSSLSQASADTESYRLVSDVRLDSNAKIIEERYFNLRDSVLQTLQRHFEDPDWISRIATSFGKAGGINAEGISTYRNNSIMVGLRSPLYSKKFGDKVFGKQFSLSDGLALIYEVDDFYDSHTPAKIHTLDLKGEGIRAMEYLDDIDKVLIVSGSVPKRSGYNLWLWSKSGFLQKLNVKHFNGLCRPEAVLTEPKGGSVYILSEESGKACENVTYNFIKLSYKKG